MSATMLTHLQYEFAGALLDADRAVPASVTSWTMRQPGKRFAVYRNNVIVSLIDALRTRFPATERIVGEEFFVAMAHRFATHHPPRSPVMMWYGDDFPAFINSFEPAQELAYLGDVARLEAARTHAYHAADAAPIDASAFRGVPPERLCQTCAILHPSMSIVQSRYPVVTIWAMNAGERDVAPVDTTQAEDALVIRPEFDVFVHNLPPGSAEFLRSIADGHPISAAAETAANSAPSFDLPAVFAILMGTGVATGLQLPNA